jgi:hypothetical protein
VKRLVVALLGVVLLVVAALALWLVLVRAVERGGADARADSVAAAEAPPSDAPLEAPRLLAAEPEAASARESLPVSTVGRADEVRIPAATPEMSVSFHGLVLDGATRLPIARARATVAGGEPDQPSHASEAPDGGEATSDGAGRFELRLSPGELGGSARLRADGYGEETCALDDAHDAPERAQVIELLPAAALEVRVLDAGGAPERGGEVRLARPGRSDISADFLGRVDAGLSWSTTTDADGVARFGSVPAEVELGWEVLVEPLSYGNAGHLALAPGETRRIEVRLGGNARLFGHVRDEQGAAVPGLELWLGQPQATFSRRGVATAASDAQGRFEFVNVPFETFVLGLLPEESDFTTYGETLLTIDRSVVEHDLEVTRGLFLSGRVLRSAEAVGELVSAEVHALDGTWLDSDRLDGGAFRLGPLPPGEYLVSAAGIGAATAIVRALAGASDLELPQLAARSFRIRIEGARGPFELQARDLQRTMVSFWDKEDAEFSHVFTPGRHALSASAAGELVGLLAIDVDEVAPPKEPEELVLRLERGARCTFVHRAALGTRRLQVRVDDVPYPLVSFGDELVAGASRTLLVPARPLVAELLEGQRVVARETLSPTHGQRLRVELVPAPR